MTIKRLIHIMLATGLLGAFGSANAVSISAFASATNVLPGGQVTVEFYGDFSDDPTVGGTFDILYNNGDLAVASYVQEPVGDPGFFANGTLTSGSIVGGGFGDFNGISGNFLIATVVFDVIGTFSDTTISMQDGVDPFFSQLTFQQQTVEYNGVTLSQVPLPAAVWLMMGALGAIFGFGRKKA